MMTGDQWQDRPARLVTGHFCVKKPAEHLPTLIVEGVLPAGCLAT
jgi:hypothetical protein